MIVKPQEMNFADKNVTILIAGAPGVGKTTLACSAPDVVVIDTDEGMSRVKPEHRKDSSMCRTYEEILADIKDAEGLYKTIVFDTCGSLIESMKEWAMRTDPTARKRNGGFSQTGFGVVKSEFLRLSAEVRKKFNVVYIFHEQKTKEEETTWYELVCEGSAKTIVWQPCDLGAHMYIEGGKRMLGFSPTANYNAKSGYGIKGVLQIPELKDGEANTFLAQIFDKVRQNIAFEAEVLKKQMEEYEQVMSNARAIIDAVKEPAHVQAALDQIEALHHVLTSSKEAKAALKTKLAELKITYNKDTKTYEYIEA